MRFVCSIQSNWRFTECSSLDWRTTAAVRWKKLNWNYTRIYTCVFVRLNDRSSMCNDDPAFDSCWHELASTIFKSSSRFHRRKKTARSLEPSLLEELRTQQVGRTSFTLTAFTSASGSFWVEWTSQDIAMSPLFFTNFFIDSSRGISRVRILSQPEYLKLNSLS